MAIKDRLSKDKIRAAVQLADETLFTSAYSSDANIAKNNEDKNKREYIKKLMEAVFFNNDERVNVIFYANHSLKDVSDILLEEAKKYNVEQVIALGIGLEDLGYVDKTARCLILGNCAFDDHLKEKLMWLDNDYRYQWIWHTEEQIKKMVPVYPNFNHDFKTKIVMLWDDQAVVPDEYKPKFDELRRIYYNEQLRINEDFWDTLLYDKEVMTIRADMVAPIPNRYWASRLKCDESCIWSMLNDMVYSINSNEYKEEMARLEEIKRLLNSMQIKRLHFNTDAGTDFRISLTEHSKWISEPHLRYNGKRIVRYYNNFPSFEIFTSPDCYTAEGRVVLTKPNFRVGVNEGIYSFRRGKLTKCQTDNKSWNQKALDKENNLFRIGEIALVPITSPLNKANIFKAGETSDRFFESVINGDPNVTSSGRFNSVNLDENTGCHLALGDSYTVATDLGNVSKEIMRKNRFNVANKHFDFVFGDDSISVEAEVSGRRKILLMEDGKWKI